MPCFPHIVIFLVFFLGSITKCSSSFLTVCNRYIHLHFHWKGVISSSEQSVRTFGLLSSICTPLVCTRIVMLAAMANAAKGLQLSMGKDHKGLLGVLVRLRLIFEISVPWETQRQSITRIPNALLGLLLWRAIQLKADSYLLGERLTTSFFHFSNCTN